MVHALDSLIFTAESVDGPGVELGATRVEVDFVAAATKQQAAVSVRVSPRGDLALLLGEQLTLGCQLLDFAVPQALDLPALCNAGTVEVHTGPGRPARSAQWRLRSSSNASTAPAGDGAGWAFDLEPLRTRLLRVGASAASTGDGWRARFDLGRVPATALQRVLRSQLPQGLELTAGSLSGRVSLRVRSSGLSTARARVLLDVQDLAFTNPQGTRAAEDLGGRLTLDTTLSKPARLSAELKLGSGLAYFEPMLIDSAEGAIAVRTEARLGTRRLRIDKLRYQQAGRLLFDASASVGLAGSQPQLNALTLDLPQQALGPLYQTYLQPLLPSSLGDELSLSGGVRARVDWRRGAGFATAAAQSSATLSLQGARVARGESAYLLNGLEGDLHWGAGGAVPGSRLAWSAGALRDFDIGPGSATLRLAGSEARLLEPLRVALLDGSLEVSRFAAELGAQPRFELDARLAPVSLAEVTSRLGWPALAGSLGGDFSRLAYANGGLDLGGEIAVQVFDGAVRVSALRVDDLFGALPQVRADVTVDRISLAPMTDAFDFGRITGRVSGRVNGLHVQGSKPVAFDAYIATPSSRAADDLPHRISQRAVDNLTSLGGAGGTLANSFLGLFKNFRYARLGLGCQLRNGRCRMRGVEPAERGYYVVRGSGLPRVDVIGFNEDVDWDTLMNRLASATRVEAPVVR